MSAETTPNVRTYGWQRFMGKPYMDDGETPRCTATVNRETGLRAVGGGAQCERAGKHLETDRIDQREYWFCGTHAPSKVNARHEKQDARRAADREAARADERIREAAHVMLAALEAAVHDRPSAHSDAVWAQMNDAITKARSRD